MTNAAFLTSVQTSATGTNFVTFPAYVCDGVHVINNTGTTLAFKRGSDSATFELPTGSGYSFYGITNANQLSVKRADDSNTQVTIKSIEAEYLS
jgi:hypothetical protein